MTLGINTHSEDTMKLVNYMSEHYGIRLEKKLSLIEDRLRVVLKQKGFASIAEYFNYVINDNTGEEAKVLVTRLTTNYTYFMREEVHYKFLTETILPSLTKTLKDRDLRIWSAGCSSGEEPYTTAMTLDDHFGPDKKNWDTKILATDISPQVLAMATEAVYPADRLKNLNPSWIDRYFIKTGADHFMVNDKIRAEVIFRSFNLMSETLPFRKKFHVIFCRNVMIYFDKKTSEALVNRFCGALEVGGHLFIGLSESLTGADSRLKRVRPSIYEKLR